MPLNKNPGIVLTFVAVGVFGIASLGAPQPLLDNFQTMTIDPDSLRIKFDGLLPMWPSPNYDFYQRSRIGDGTALISHLGPNGSNISYNTFSADVEGILVTRSKTQALLQGPYGTVYAQSTYYYGKQYNHAPTDFHTELYFNE